MAPIGPPSRATGSTSGPRHARCVLWIQSSVRRDIVFHHRTLLALTLGWLCFFGSNAWGEPQYGAGGPVGSGGAAAAVLPPAPQRRPPSDDPDALHAAPPKLDVQPVARDDEIRARLQSVLDATGWFTNPEVRVQDGVVFLSGRAETDELKRWAGDLARNTQDVAAVANAIDVEEPSPWDFTATSSGISRVWRDFIASMPFVLSGILILVLAAMAGVLITRGVGLFLRPRIEAKLLRGLLSRAAGVVVFLIGVYVVLRVAGLTQLALTVVGGTGLVGLALGIAFRDITENYLASIFLSVQRPFETGDLIEVAGVMGYVQQLNVRTTVLMMLDGNLVQVPNSAVYKSNIRNFTANPNRRETFTVGIGYDDPIAKSQEIALGVLSEHPAVLADPEPLVLVEGLGASTINLRLYFWLNGHEHSNLKVRSSVIRLIKRAFQQNGISMPDEAREIVFPQGVPVTMSRESEAASREDAGKQLRPGRTPGSPEDSGEVTTRAEGGLSSDAVVLEEQARQAKPLDQQANLLRKPPHDPSNP